MNLLSIDHDKNTHIFALASVRQYSILGVAKHRKEPSHVVIRVVMQPLSIPHPEGSPKNIDWCEIHTFKYANFEEAHQNIIVMDK